MLLSATPRKAEDDGSGPALEVDANQLAVPATALISIVASLTLTGVLGRVQRNHPEGFTLALGALILGALLAIVAAALRRGKWRWTLAHVIAGCALGLSAGGLLLGTAKAVQTAGEAERPLITTSVERGKNGAAWVAVSATVSVGNIPSDRRLVVLVDGLNPGRGGNYFEPETLYQAYVGPDGDGKVSIPISLQARATRYEAVGVKAYVGRQGDARGDVATVCERYPRRVSTSNAERRAKVGPGCAIVMLPR
jgi:hypothetical protein